MSVYCPQSEHDHGFWDLPTDRQTDSGLILPSATLRVIRSQKDLLPALYLVTVVVPSLNG
eukprot:1008920-Rhodomonas_salina.1